MEQITDRQAGKQVLKGDKDSYGILLERYKKLVYRVALNTLGDCDQAEDIVQETFLRAYQNLQRCRQKEKTGGSLGGGGYSHSPVAP